jgi:ABC-2 type transport system permease protein
MSSIRNTSRIAAKEFLDMTRDGRFRWSAAILSILTLISLVTGIRTFLDVDRLHSEAQAQARWHWDHQGEKNPHAAAHYGMYLFEPKSFLSFFDPGVESFTGVSVFLEAHRQNDFQNRQARDGTSIQRFGQMTAAMVLQTLVPLVIIFLTFPIIAGERDQGTLRYLLSHGVKPSELAFGKSLGSVAALSIIILPAILLCVAGILLHNADAETISFARVLGLAGAYAAYASIFFAISVSASAIGLSPSTVLVVLLGFWISNVLIAPRLSADLSSWAVPLPSAFEFDESIEDEIRQGIDGHDPASERLEKLKQELLTKYRVESVEELPVSFAGVALQESERYGNRVFEKHYGELWSKIDRQDTITQLLSFISPTMAVRSISMALCGSDTADHIRFVRQAEAYRRNLIEKLNQDLVDNAAEAGFSYTADEEMWKSIPEFRFRPATTARIIEDQSIAVLSLSLWFAFALTGAIAFTRKPRID